MKGTTKTTITLTMTLEEAKVLKNLIDCINNLSPVEDKVLDDLLRTLNNLGVN